MATRRSGTRPRNRKALIGAAAARAFAQLGYHRVGIDEVAESVGITGGAIYWHFDTKQALLAFVVDDAVGVLDAAIEEATVGGRLDLDVMLRHVAEVTVERRELGVVMQREVNHLDPVARDEVRLRIRKLIDRAAEQLAASRPELDRTDARFLVRAALVVLGSPAFHRATLPPARFKEVVHALAAAVLSTPLRRLADASATNDDGADVAAHAAASRASRRETLLDASLRLFAERGYQAVTMDEIGAAVGMRGPSVYGHFRSKADLLLAAHVRGAEGLQLGMARALASAPTPSEALNLVLRAYVSFSFEHPDLLRTLLTETMYLPPDELRRLRRLQHDYVAEWVRLLLAVRPELTYPEARVVTHAVLETVNDHTMNRRLRVRPLLQADVLAAGGTLFSAPLERPATAGEPLVRPGA